MIYPHPHTFPLNIDIVITYWLKLRNSRHRLSMLLLRPFFLQRSLDLKFWDMAMSFKKFKCMLVSSKRTQLGMTIGTRLMEFFVPKTYLLQVRSLLKDQ
jgi:hypothetical protein